MPSAVGAIINIDNDIVIDFNGHKLLYYKYNLALQFVHSYRAVPENALANPILPIPRVRNPSGASYLRGRA